MSVSFNTLVLAWVVLAIALVPFQLFTTAPYGRHVRAGWGPSVPNRLGWVMMEIVSLVVFGGLFLSGPSVKSAASWTFFACWTGHYIHRSLIFPFATRTRGKRMPLVIVLSAMMFNVVNGGLNGVWLGYLSPAYPQAWLLDPRFLIGVALFIGGAVVNIAADYTLIALRPKYRTADYSIPRGGLFEFVSCPNLLGEIVQWAGFALMSWNLPALSFAVWTAANLGPRALSHHRWYRSHFGDYPEARKALIPFVL